ncbi:MAG: hypothetical protein RMM53_11430, partial [Bacteroidia bacterium]|nr:hypothetical protein [Bacteroidia bacterium]MDW8334818.1 hypothetical protein [Bacteroidia bacterium]
TAVGAALTAAGVGTALLDAYTSDSALFRRLERRVGRDWQQEVARTLEVVHKGQDPAHVPVLEYNYRGELLRWNDHRYVPDNLLSQTRFFDPRPELVIERHAVHYAYKLHDAGRVKFVLFPVRRSFPIRNRYLQDFVYLGRYNERPEVRESAWRMRLSLAPVRAGINVLDEKGEFVFGVLIDDAAPFRRRTRLWALALATAGGALLFWAYACALNAVVPPGLRREAAFFAPLLVVRVLMYVFRFPGSYLETELFSSRLMAVNELLPSLGDLTLNTSLAAAFFLRWLRKPFRGRFAAWAPAAILFLPPVLYAAFLEAFESVVSNARIYYDLTDLSQINVYTFALYYNAAAVLAVVSTLTKRLLTAARERQNWLWPAALVQGLTLLVVYSPYAALTYWLWLATLRFAVFGRSAADAAWILSVYALTTHYAAARARDRGLEERLLRLAARYSAPRDFVTEASLDEAVEGILTDVSLWFPDTVRRDEIVPKLVNNHLLGFVKGYDFRAFVFDSSGARLDPHYEHTPFAPEATPGGRTLSRFFRIYGQGRATGELYMGRIFVPRSRFGPLTVQIELHPKAA